MTDSVTGLPLDATVTDDGLPSNTLTYTWSVSSGPDGATFADANAEDTTVTFVNAGTYVLQFEAPENERYPCLALAAEAMRTGGTAPAILNAANEVAVQAFLDGQIPFSDIPAMIRFALEQCSVHEATSLEVILADDAAARATAGHCLGATGKVVTQ